MLVEPLLGDRYGSWSRLEAGRERHEVVLVRPDAYEPPSQQPSAIDTTDPWGAFVDEFMRLGEAPRAEPPATWAPRAPEVSSKPQSKLAKSGRQR